MSKPQEVTNEELVLVKDYIIYPVILDVLQRDMQKIKLVDLKLPEVYLNNLKHIQNLVTRELTDINKELRKRGIKIYEQEKSVHKGISAKYLCRRYTHEISFLPSLIRTSVIIKVSALLNLDLTSMREISQEK